MRRLADLEQQLESDSLYAKACIASTANTLYYILSSEPVVGELRAAIQTDPSNIPRLLTYVRRLLVRDPPRQFRFYNEVAVASVLIALSTVDNAAYWNLVTAMGRDDDVLLGWIPPIARLTLKRHEPNSFATASWNGDEFRRMRQFDQRATIRAVSPYTSQPLASALQA